MFTSAQNTCPWMRVLTTFQLPRDTESDTESTDVKATPHLAARGSFLLCQAPGRCASLAVLSLSSQVSRKGHGRPPGSATQHFFTIR